MDLLCMTGTSMLRRILCRWTFCVYLCMVGVIRRRKDDCIFLDCIHLV